MGESNNRLDVCTEIELLANSFQYLFEKLEAHEDKIKKLEARWHESVYLKESSAGGTE